MKVLSCPKGHFYDAEKYGQCPYCAQSAESFSEAPPFTAPIMPADDDGVTVAYDSYNNDSEITQSYWNISRTEDAPTQGEETSVFLNVPDFLNAEEERFEPVVGWLVCVEGKERGRDYRLFAGRNYIGRSLKMDVSIPDDQKMSSERHCSVIYDPRSSRFVAVPGDYALTTLNGETLNAPCGLNDGDVITCGATKLCFIGFCKEGRNWK